MLPLAVGQLILDKYGRLGIIVVIQTDTKEALIEIEWLNPKHGKMLCQSHKAEELRQNYLFLRERIANGWV